MRRITSIIGVMGVGLLTSLVASCTINLNAQEDRISHLEKLVDTKANGQEVLNVLNAYQQHNLQVDQKIKALEARGTSQ